MLDGWLFRILITGATALLLTACVTASQMLLPSLEEEDLQHAGRYGELIRFYETKYPEQERRTRLASGRAQLATASFSGIVDRLRYQLFLRSFPTALTETGQLERAQIEVTRSLHETQLLLQESRGSGTTTTHLLETRSYLRRIQSYLDWLRFGAKATFVDPVVDPDVRALPIARQIPQVIERAFVEDKLFGNHKKALEYLDRTQAMAQELGIKDLDSKLAYTMQAARRKAWIQMRLGRLSDAKATLQDYRRLAEDPTYRAGKVLGAQSEYFRGYVSMMDSTAGAVYGASRDFELAKRHFDAARESLNTISPNSQHMWDRNAWAAYWVLHGAYFLGLNGQYEEAAKEVEEGLRILRPAYIDALANEIDIETAYLHAAQLHLRAGHLELARTRATEALKLAERYRSSPVQIAANTLLGALLVQQGRPLDALRPLESAASASQSIESTDNWSLHYWLGRAYTLMKRDGDAIAQYVAAVQEVEKLWEGRFDDVQRQLSFMDDRFMAYEAAIDALIDRGRNEEALSMAERSKARAAYEARDAETAVASSPMFASRRGQPLRYAEVRALLPPDTSLLEYYVGTRSVIGFAVNPAHTLTTLRLKISATELQERVDAFTEGIRSGNAAHAARLGRALYVDIVKPFETRTATSVLGIVPHGVLHRLPFHALVVDTTGSAAKQGGRPLYVIDRQAVFYAPSATLLSLSLAKQRAFRDGILVLASPPAIDAAGGERLPKLIGAEAEAKRVASLFEVSKVLLDTSATETNAKRNVAAYGSILFAAHAMNDKDDPRRSAVYLAGDADNDGRLSIKEIEALTISAGLVVLSACSSGQVSNVTGGSKQAPLSLGDDLSSLNRAFLKAGASSIVSSLWVANDDTAEEFVIHFLDQYARRRPRAEAARAAMLGMIADGHSPLSGPVNWAPYFLTGDWR